MGGRADGDPGEGGDRPGQGRRDRTERPAQLSGGRVGEGHVRKERVARIVIPRGSGSSERPGFAFRSDAGGAEHLLATGEAGGTTVEAGGTAVESGTSDRDICAAA